MGVRSSFLSSNMKFGHQQQQQEENDNTNEEEENSLVANSLLMLQQAQNNSRSTRQTNSKFPKNELDFELFFDLVRQFPVI